MKTVLMIAPYFVPRRRVGSLRPFKFAIHLKSFGWNPVVLTIADPKNSLTKKERQLMDGIEVIDVKSPFDRTAKTEGSKKRRKKITDRISRWIDRQIPMDSWIFLFWYNYSWILDRAKKINPHLIWSTGDPWSGHWLGEKLSDDLEKPWIADFRDPWTLTEVNLRQRSWFSSEMDRKMEKKVVEKAGKLIFTSGAAQKRYEVYYGLKPGKAATIYNAFDRSLFGPADEKLWGESLDPSKLHILFYGSFRRLSPVKPIADALELLKENDPEAAGSLRVHSFGTPEPEEMATIQKAGLAFLFVEHAPIVPEKTLSVLKRADLLLVSTNKDRKHIIPAKLWDYLAVNAPILSIAPNPEIADILTRSGAGLQIDPDKPEEIARVLKQCVEARQKKVQLLRSLRDENFERNLFDAHHTAKQLASIFDELS